MVESFGLHAGGLGVNVLGWLSLLHASLDVPIELGTVIIVDTF
jgi:hypothetical protein